MEEKTVNIWVLKYWLTSGVVCVTAMPCNTWVGDGIMYRYLFGGYEQSVYKRGTDYALSADEAIECVDRLAAKKRASLAKQLAKVNKQYNKVVTALGGGA